MPMKFVKPIITFLISVAVLPCLAQTIVVQNVIRMPTDTVVKNQLIASLNGFLRQKSGPNKNNEYILKEDLPQTSNLIDEIKGMDQGTKGKDFFTCYITNVTKVKSDTYQ